MITKPMLPPKAGYVEVEITGERVYKNASTGVLLQDESGYSQLDILEAQVTYTAMMTDTLLEV